jgi:hypothetical protein
MFSIDQVRKIDPGLENAPDDELEGVLGVLYEFAGLMFDDWVENGGSKCPAGLLQGTETKGKIKA